jgi:putative ABC transport system permease protein
VKAAYPLYLETVRGAWWPGSQYKAYPIRVVALEVGSSVFRPATLPEIARHIDQLRLPSTALVDARSKSIYHLPVGADLKRPHEMALAGHAIKLVGQFSLGTDFAVNGNLIMSSENFARFFPDRGLGGDPLDPVDLGLVEGQPGVEPETLAQRLREALPGDVLVCTKAEFVAREVNFWKTSTPTGFIFSLGAVIGFVVGTIICYQIVSADITDHLSEFATLKAMGYRDRYFVSFVLQEALLLSLLGFVPGMAVSCGLYQGLAWYTGLDFLVKLERSILVLGLTVMMCMISGGLAMRRVLRADPADLF